MPITPPLPAHETKNKPILHYPVLPTPLVLSLRQSDTTQNTTGSTLWLGAQVLAIYLFDVYGSKPRLPASENPRPRAIDLGSGIGLTANVMAMLGFNVVATDLKIVIDAVLSHNIENNSDHVKVWGQETVVGGVAKGCGNIDVRQLDWFVEPEEWDWNGATSIAPREGLPSPESDNASGPPFDLIVTADTLYTQELVIPLLRTIKELSIKSRKGKKCPLVLVALERRDPQIIQYALDLAKKERFDCKKVSDGKLKKCLDAVGMNWGKEDWEGVEIWRWTLRCE